MSDENQAAEAAKTVARDPKVDAALSAYPGAKLVTLATGYPVREPETRRVIRYCRQVVIRPSTLNDEIQRDVWLAKYAAEGPGGDENRSQRILEAGSPAFAVGAMLAQVIVAWDDIINPGFQHVRELTRSDVEMLDRGLGMVDDAFTKVHSGEG